MLAVTGCATASAKGGAAQIRARDVVAETCGGDCPVEDAHRRVTLRNSAFGCAAGRRGAASFLLENQVIATLAPGASKVVLMPHGVAEFVVEDAGGRASKVVEVGDRGPLEVVAGCLLSRFDGMSLRPLAVVVPVASGCQGVKVRAGGLEFQLDEGEVQTLFVPAGQHVIRAGGQAQTVTVGPAGAIVEVPLCTKGGARVTRRGGAGGGPG
jgi:hypothetical protein